MPKTWGDFLKIFITAVISMLMTFVVMSGTVISKKADKDYVDEQDKELQDKIEKVEDEYKEECKELKKDFLRIVEEIKGVNSEMQKDIKELLKRK